MKQVLLGSGADCLQEVASTFAVVMVFCNIQAIETGSAYTGETPATATFFKLERRTNLIKTKSMFRIDNITVTTCTIVDRLSPPSVIFRCCNFPGREPGNR
jgi:hypothetical protein